MIRDLFHVVGDTIGGLLTVTLLISPMLIPFVIEWIGPKPKSRRRK